MAGDAAVVFPVISTRLLLSPSIRGEPKKVRVAVATNVIKLVYIPL